MSAISRFLGEGLRDAERRVGRLTATAPIDDRSVLATFDRSAVFSAVERALGRVGAVAGTSVAAGRLRRITSRWDAQGWASRRWSSGVIVFIAAAVHVALILWQGRPAGWLWLILPAIVAAVGAVLIAGSGVGGRPIETR